MDSIFYANKGFQVSPLSMTAICKKSLAFRLLNDKYIDKNGCLDIIKVLEYEYGKFFVVNNEDLNGCYAKTDSAGYITISVSTYEGACNGCGRSRFTIAHELGHCLLHIGQIGFAREANQDIKVFENSEWQANEFAAQALFPFYLVKKYLYMPQDEIANILMISKDCVRIRIDKFNKYSYLSNLAR